MKKPLVVITALLIVASVAGGVLMATSKDRILSNFYENQGVNAEEKQNFTKAAKAYQKVLYYDEDRTDARLGLSRVYLSQSDPEMAEKVLLEGIERSPDNVEFYISLSSLYVNQSRFNDACTLLNNIQSDYVKMKIGSMRPDSPKFSPAPGSYDKRIQVQIKSDGESDCYFTLGGLDHTQKYTEELALEAGRSSISAISVSANGLVSDIAKGEYNLERIVERAYFIDPAIEAMARAALNKPTGTFMTDELWEVRSLSNLSENGVLLADEINSFEDLKLFTSLEELKLYKITKKEIPFHTMPELTTLSSLTLSGCALTSAVFGELPFFRLGRELDLSGNRIEELTGIKSLPNLEKLIIKGNNVSDLKDLASLANLNYLDASENAIRDLSSLTENKKLSCLFVSDNRISDLSPIRALTELAFLDISKNNIADISDLSACKSIKGLICKENNIEDISPLSELINLEGIDFGDNQISSINALGALKKLKNIGLSGNNITDIAPLCENKEITQLMISDNGLRDIASVKNLPSLMILDITKNPIEDYSPLAECDALQTVFSDNQNENEVNSALVSGMAEGLTDPTE